jgi:hypothetical protein
MKEVTFPIYIVSPGFSLSEYSLERRVSKKSGKQYLNNYVPYFLDNPKGVAFMKNRKCTGRFKIQEIKKKVREILGDKIKDWRREHRRGMKPPVLVQQWIGISTDEIQRMKMSDVPYIENVFPLIDVRLSRQHCIEGLARYGWTAIKSACVFCPFRDNKGWQELKTSFPDDFAKAVEFDEAMRLGLDEYDEVVRDKAYIHRSLKPLKDIEFVSGVPDPQISFSFLDECEGMCGV